MRIACWIPKATNTPSEYVTFVLFHCKNGCTNAPQFYVTRTLPAYLVSWHRRWSALKKEAVNYSVTLVTLQERQICQPSVVFVTNSLYRAVFYLFRYQSTLFRIWSGIFSFIRDTVSKARGPDGVTSEIMLPAGRCSIPQRDRDFPTFQKDLAGNLAHQDSHQAVKEVSYRSYRAPGLEYGRSALFGLHTENDWSFTPAVPSVLMACCLYIYRITVS